MQFWKRFAIVAEFTRYFVGGQTQCPCEVRHLFAAQTHDGAGDTDSGGYLAVGVDDGGPDAAGAGNDLFVVEGEATGGAEGEVFA